MSRDLPTDLDPGARNPLVHLLLTYGRPYWPSFVGSAVARFASTIGGIRFLPFAVGFALDAVVLNSRPFALPLVPDRWTPTDPVEQLAVITALIAVGAILSAGLNGLGIYLSARFQQPVIHDIRIDAYDRLQRLSVTALENESTGDLMSLLNNDVNNLAQFVGGGVVQNTIWNTGQVLIMFGFVWLLSPSVSLLMAIPMTFYLVNAYVYGRVIEPRFEHIREMLGELNSRVQDSIAGIATVKAFGMERDESKRVTAASRNYHDANWSKIRANLGQSLVGGVLGGLLQLSLVLVGGYWAITGTAPLGDTVTAGAVYSAFSYGGGFRVRMERYLDTVESYENAMASARRIMALLGDPDVVPEREDAVALGTVDGEVGFDDVTFGYDEEPVLREISARIEPGETVGVVGPTGAGKSTLVRHVPRFYDPDEGSVTIDGTNVTGVTLASLRNAIGFVAQEPFLFPGTVHENVAYNTAADREAVEAACRTAGAHEFVVDLPDDYDTEIGERGVKLSGGQRQRLAIARELVRDPAVFVMDEATSHVDNETEAIIKRHLGAFTHDRTTLVIAHRLSTVRDADRILVMDRGEIVERGTHEELLDADGLYANLWNVQVGHVDALPESFVERASRGDVREL